MGEVVLARVCVDALLPRESVLEPAQGTQEWNAG